MAEMYNDEYYAQDDHGFKPDGGYEGGEGGSALWDAEEAAINGTAPRGGFEALTKELQNSKNKKVRRTAQQYMDEYYALDYEDVLGEGEDALPTRFKYRAVEPAGFGVGRQPLPPHQPPARCPWECPSLPCPLPSGSDGPPPAHRRAADRPRAARARRQGARQDRPHPARQAAVCAVGRRARQVARQAGAVGGGGGAAC